MEYEKKQKHGSLNHQKKTDITPLLGMDWMEKFKLTVGRIQLGENSHSERQILFNRFPELFENNEPIKRHRGEHAVKTGTLHGRKNQTGTTTSARRRRMRTGEIGKIREFGNFQRRG